MFEMMRTVEYPHFKQILKIVKGNPQHALDLHMFNAYAKL